MILEATLIGALGVMGYSKLTETSRAKKEFERAILRKWLIFTTNVGSSIENKSLQTYDMLNIIEKMYGFDSIISIPPSIGYNKFREFLPKIENIYGADIIAELSDNNKSIYLRCHLKDYDIPEKDKIRFDWYKIFHTGNKVRNSFGNTFKIKKMKEITNPNNGEIVGYTLEVSIPTELSYSDLKSYEEDITTNIGKCLIKWNKSINSAEVEIMVKQLDDNEKFIPIKPKTPYELYLAMSYSFKAIFSDLSKNPHMLYTGKSQSGKTVTVMTGITNLAYFYDEDDFLLFESMISSKQDLRIFKNLRQCMYYANNIDTSLRLFKYIKSEMDRRNRLFETSKKFIGNMYEWNKKHLKKKLPIILLAIDEMTLYAPIKSDDRDMKAKKQKCLDMLTQLIIEGASAGINILFSLQRPDKDSLNPQIKAQVGTRIGFYQPNTASSLVAMDDDSCSRLELKREAIIKYDKGTELVRTLFLTPNMIEDILKDKMIGTKHHLKLDVNGKVIIENKKEDKPSDIETKKSQSDNDNNKDTKTEKPKQPRFVTMKQKKEESKNGSKVDKEDKTIT